MDQKTIAYTIAPPLLSDPGSRIDPITAVRPVGSEPGGLEVTTASGSRYRAVVSSAGTGVLRLQISETEIVTGEQETPMLDPYLSCEPVELDSISGYQVVSNTAPPPASGELDGPATHGATPNNEAGGNEGAANEAAGCRSTSIVPEFSWQPGAGGLRWGAVAQPPALATLTGSGSHIGPVKDADGSVRGWVLSVTIGSDDAVYGGGESFQGPDLRGRVRTCVNYEAHGASGLDPSYLSVPMFWSDGGWGVYANTGAPVRADIGASHVAVAALETTGAALDLFFYCGEPAQILANHHRVTGLPGTFPDWAFGVWTSRCTYLDAGEVESIVEGYERADCPVDVVHVDGWQPGDVLSDLSTLWEVDRGNWPEGWTESLHEKGVRVSLWHNPYLRSGTKAGDEAVAAGYVMTSDDGEPVYTNDMHGRLLVDFTNPAAADWWRKMVGELLRAEGADSIKADFAEEVPPAARCHDGRTGWEIRNEYALLYQHHSNTALREATGDSDVAMFCRSGTAGAQRYPCHWVGDTPSTWIGLATALRACLSLSLSGYSIVGSDIGGFWVGGTTHIPNRAVREHRSDLYVADVEPELFARWAQWGALSPAMRFHGAGRREPWAYPSPYSDVAVEACRLRRRLREYLVATGREAQKSGTPMIRPMVLAFPGDRAARDASLQYMLGDEVLVAPVLRPGGQLRLWAPPGTWAGLEGAPTIEGPGWHELELALDQVPAWVRAGSEGRVLQ